MKTKVKLVMGLIKTNYKQIIRKCWKIMNKSWWKTHWRTYTKKFVYYKEVLSQSTIIETKRLFRNDNLLLLQGEKEVAKEDVGILKENGDDNFGELQN